MRPIVVLGTGTDVGKTYVCANLAHALLRLAPDHPLLALKPIESGLSPSESPASLFPNSDTARLAAASTLPSPTPNPLFALPDPISPHLAARRVGAQIEIAPILTWATSALPCNTLLLIETAGGVFTPLSDTSTNLDLARAFEPALWVLVAPDSLGALHDVTATLTAMRALAREPDYLVLTEARPPDASTGTNAHELIRLGLPPPFVLPRNDPESIDALATRLRLAAAASDATPRSP